MPSLGSPEHDDAGAYPPELPSPLTPPTPAVDGRALVGCPLSPPVLSLAPLGCHPLPAPKTNQSTPTASTTGAPKHRHGSIEDMRRKKRANGSRAVKRHLAKQAAPYGDYAVRPSTVNKHVRQAASIRTTFDAHKLKHTRRAYTGGRAAVGSRRSYALSDLVGEGSAMGFTLEQWDGRYAFPNHVSRPPHLLFYCRSSAAITDDGDRVIGVLCGQPEDPTWDKCHHNAAEAVKEAGDNLRFPRGADSHRRGDFPAVAVGASFGGGQRVSCLLLYRTRLSRC